MPVLFTDTFTGVNGAAWDATKWTTVTSASNGIIDIQNNEGRLLVNSTGNANYFARAVAVMNDVVNQEISGKFRMPVAGTGGRLLFGLNLSGPLTGEFTATALTTVAAAYVLISGTTASQNIGFATRSMGTNSNSGAGATQQAITLTTTATYGFRIRREGNTLSGKIWDTVGAEPSGWLFTQDISTFTLPAGKAFISRETQSTTGATAEFRVDDVTVDTLTVPDASVDITLDTPSATGQAIDPVVRGGGVMFNMTMDAQATDGTAINDTVQSIVVNQVANGGGNKSFYSQFAKSSLPAGAVVSKVYLWVSPTVMPSATSSITVGPYLNNTTAASGTPVTFSATGSGTSHAIGQRVEFDVTDIWNAAGSTASFWLKATTLGGVVSMSLASIDNTTVAYRPQLEIVYTQVPVPVTVDVPTVTATAQASDVIVTTQVSTAFIADTPSATAYALDATVGEGTGVNLDTPTATGTAYDTTVEVFASPNVTVEVETATAYVLAPEPLVAINITTDITDTPTATGFANDVTVEMTQSAVIELDTPMLIATAYQPALINGEPIVGSEGEDLYFQSTMRTLSGVKKGLSGRLSSEARDSQLPMTFATWFRLNERSGVTITDRADFTLPNVSAFYNGVTIGLNNGPNGRHNVYFNGAAYINQNGQDVFYPPTSLEFTFRTDRRTQFIMGGTGTHYADIGNSGSTSWEMWLIDGKLTYKTVYEPVGSGPGQFEVRTDFTAFTDLADNKWHHIVFQQVPERNAVGANAYGAEVYVDARLEFRRRAMGGAAGFPDYIGGRPVDLYGFTPGIHEYGALSSENWFLGDMTELVFRNGRILTVDEIAIQRDNVMGIVPVRVETARALGFAPQATAKGNKARLLVLNFGRPINNLQVNMHQAPFDAQFPDTLGPNATATGIANVVYFNWQGSGTDVVPFHYSVFGPGVQQYHDIVTDNPRLIDLDVDLNMDDYDVITMINYPQSAEQIADYEAMDEGALAPYVPARAQLEKLTAQIRHQVQVGKGLVITDPGAAIGVGLVDKVDYVPMFKEKVYLDRRLGTFTGIYDWRSAYINPFQGGAGNVIPNDQAASRWVDTHANIKQRVRHLVPGLTDTPMWLVTDFQVWQNNDPMGTPPANDYMRHEERPTGLAIGDEMFMEGSGVGFSLADWVIGGGPGWGTYDRRPGWLAAPIANIKAGKALTTFTPKFWMKNVEVNNPYKDYATSIVVEPGDSWDGVTVQGKVFANFTESGVHWASVDLTAIQVDPDASHTPTEKDYWTWTHARGSWNGTTVNGDTGSGGIALQIGADGAITVDGKGKTTGSNKFTGLVTFSWSAGVPEVQVKAPSLSNLGINWVIKPNDVSGNASVGVETAVASAHANEVEVTASRSATIDLPTARAYADVYPMRDVAEKDVTVLVTTATATAQAGAFRETVDLTTATAIGVAYNVEGSTMQDADLITLVLPMPALTLYMEEA